MITYSMRFCLLIVGTQAIKTYFCCLLSPHSAMLLYSTSKGEQEQILTQLYNRNYKKKYLSDL